MTGTIRHNCLLYKLNFEYITGLVDIDLFLIYVDIPSHTLPGGGTVPPHFLVTTEIRDLVIIDRMEVKKDILSLLSHW